MFQFQDEKTRQDVLKNGPYLIYIKPLLIKYMTCLFYFGSASISILPMQVTLLGLPCDIWNAKVCSKIGTPFYTDALTGTKKCISFARVLIDVNLAKELVREVAIILPNGILGKQAVIYENLPKFCTSCNVIGHYTDFCKGKMVEQSAHPQRQLGNQQKQ